MGRPLRPEAAGRTFHVTARATWDRDLFLDDDDRADFMRLLDRVARRYGWQVLGWCLLGRHYHLLVRTPRPNLGRGMRDLNGAYARRFNERHARFGSVLAGRYADRVVRSHAHLLDTLRYIAMNPVRAGLVRRPEHWRWSSHGTPAGLGRRPVGLAAHGALQALRGRTSGYRRFVEACAGLASRLVSGTSHTTASGGSTSSAEKGWSLQGTATASTPRPLPTSEPP